jgi:hypothetical protein
MAEIRLCGRCKKSIPHKDLEAGLTTERYGQLICQECSEAFSKKKEKGGADELQFLFESILREVKNIARVLTYESGSWLNIVGAVAQCFVFGALVFAYTKSGDVHSALLLAILFQLMALTFFVIKK